MKNKAINFDDNRLSDGIGEWGFPFTAVIGARLSLLCISLLLLLIK